MKPEEPFVYETDDNTGSYGVEDDPAIEGIAIIAGFDVGDVSYDGIVGIVKALRKEKTGLDFVVVYDDSAGRSYLGVRDASRDDAFVGRGATTWGEK